MKLIQKKTNGNTSQSPLSQAHSPGSMPSELGDNLSLNTAASNTCTAHMYWCTGTKKIVWPQESAANRSPCWATFEIINGKAHQQILVIEEVCLIITVPKRSKSRAQSSPKSNKCWSLLKNLPSHASALVRSELNVNHKFWGSLQSLIRQLSGPWVKPKSLIPQAARRHSTCCQPQRHRAFLSCYCY